MSPRTGTLLLARDIGAEWGSQKLAELAQKLQSRLHQPVVVCSVLDDARPFLDAAQSLIIEELNHLVIVPFGLLAIPEHGQIPRSIEWIKRQSPQLSVHSAFPLTWIELSGWLLSTAIDAMGELSLRPDSTAILLAGYANSDPMINANLAILAHLIREKRSVASVSHAFLDDLQPCVTEAIQSIALAGIVNVLVIPWQHVDEQSQKRLANEVQRARQDENVNAVLIKTGLEHSSLINLLVANHCAALSEEWSNASSSDGALLNTGDPSTAAEMKQRSNDAYDLKQLETRINSMLPPQYRGQYEGVSSQSMGTASLKVDAQGQVAWGEIWTSFCDLALAGGPPHRGTLLEAVTAEEARAEPMKYESVVAEIARGIQLVTALPIVASKTLGWVGIRCQSEEMAIWLMRAIIVENVMVRREEDVLYLPAGPRFTIKREIKNVITTVAKTVHYWTAHLNAMRPS